MITNVKINFKKSQNIYEVAKKNLNLFWMIRFLSSFKEKEKKIQ